MELGQKLGMWNHLQHQENRLGMFLGFSDTFKHKKGTLQLGGTDFSKYQWIWESPKI